MKKSIVSTLMIGALSALVLFSCKKDEKEEFKQTDVTGTAVLKGNVNKNVITPNGAGQWTSNSRVNMKDIRVTVKVNKGGNGGLYPNSTSAGADVYTATTDSLGNYYMTIRSNANGVNALLTIEGFSGTQDTVINGVTKKGLYATYNGLTNNLNVTMGQVITTNHAFTASNVSSNPNNIVIGTAVVSGSVGMTLPIKQTGTLSVGSTTLVPVPANTLIYLTFDKDPSILTSKVYQTTTGANGSYSFTVNTVAMGTSGFNQDATVWAPDFAAKRDTVTYSNATPTGTITGPMGVFSQIQTVRNGVYTYSIKNATNLNYSSFTQN